MKITETKFAAEFMDTADKGYRMGWHERNGGNLSYRIPKDQLEAVSDQLSYEGEWRPIGTEVPALAGEYFMVTGSGKYLGNVLKDPEDSCCIIELSADGTSYRILWGLVNGGRPTSELPTHLMNHEVRMKATDGAARVIYHCHPENLIALTFVLPLEDRVFSRKLWEMMTECPIIFPAGIGVVRWMVPGGREIAVETAKKMETYDAVVWAHHGLFCSGADFDSVFGLAHTIEKAAKIYLLIHSVAKEERQTITKEDFAELAKAFGVELNEEFLQN
ncbi:MAG: rhamnulose-1-phosphate aldolase [Eubacteriales bacterium]